MKFKPTQLENREDIEVFRFNTGTGEEPVCVLSLKSAGALRPGENEKARVTFFESLSVPYVNVISLSQIHSRIVFNVSRIDGEMAQNEWAFSSSSGGCGFGVKKKNAGRYQGDGMLTDCKNAVPCVTVADCMPVWIFDPDTGCFGVLHSGWKGTGIIAEALRMAEKNWGSKASSFYVIMGPHIRQCCYTVDRERAEYFRGNFSSDCVLLDEKLDASGSRWPYRLSLAEANISLCLSLGIKRDRILDTGKCTACSEKYGSSRRESSFPGTGENPGVTPFTSMAAFIYWPAQNG